MNKVERSVIEGWLSSNALHSEHKSAAFREMQELYEARGGGKASCSLEHNFEYLMTSEDRATKSKAMHIYAKYMRADGADDEYLTLAQAMANIR